MLLGLAPERIRDVPQLVANSAGVEAEPPPGWDGRASERVADVLARGVPGWGELSPEPSLAEELS